MPRKLIYADEAIDDLKAIRGWLTQPGSGLAAVGRLRAMRAAMKRLNSIPASTHSASIRVCVSCHARAATGLYRVNPDTGSNATAGDIRVPRVFGPGQGRSSL